MRLIDADKLEEFIKNNICTVGSDKELLTVGIDNKWCKLLDLMPTAYDTEKVVERIETDERHSFNFCIDKRHAKEIIMSGGLN